MALHHRLGAKRFADAALTAPPIAVGTTQARLDPTSPLPEPRLPLAQHDPAHRPAADALNAGEQLHLPCHPPQPSWRIFAMISRISMVRSAPR